jgi:hypothetical protein
LSRRSIAGSLAIAFLTTGALTTQSALALPEIGRCVAQPGTGRYKDANCTAKAGKLTSEKAFEFKKGAIKKAFNAAGGETVIEGASGTKIICQAQSASGEYRETLGSIKGAQKVVIRFTGCSLPALGITCETKGTQAGEFVTNSLKGSLGYISGEKTKTPVVGLELQPEKAKGPFLEFECGGGAVFVKIGVSGKTPNGNDCAIGTLTPPNLMSTTFNDAFSQSEGVQKPQSFQSTPTKVCNLEVSANGGAFERTAFGFESTITNEEALEIRA